MSTKLFIEHNSGYVNIDSEHVFFTHSGNWSETRELALSTSSIPQSRSLSRKKTQILLALGAALALYFLYLAFTYNGLIYGFVGVCTLFFVYTSFRHDKDPQFYIRRNQISIVKIEDEQITWTLANRNNETVKHVLRGVNKKGRDILHKEFKDLIDE